ncbi:MAG: MarR family winged helix-turn-helix transcriptional regulator [Pseudobdellovibrionaceae bacterium]
MTKAEKIKQVRDALRVFNREAGVLKADPYGIGLPLSQASALIDIERFGSLRPNDLVQLLKLEKSSVSRLISVLEDKDFIAISDDKKDRRSKTLSLTNKGRRAVQTINEASNNLVARTLELLSAQEQKEIVDALAKMARAVDSAIN